MSEPNTRSFTSKKLDLHLRAVSDPRMTAAQFRMFCRVLHAVNQHTSIAVLGNKTIMDDVPGCASVSSVKENRKHIASLGYWTFTPGDGRTATEYKIDWNAGAQVTAMMEARAGQRKAERREKDQAWRLSRTGGRVAAPLDEEGGRSDTPLGGRVAAPEGGAQPSPYTFMTPSTIQEATEESSLLSARGAEVAPALPSPSPSSAPPARSVPVLIDDVDDELSPAVQILRDDPEPDLAAQAAFEREVFSWLGEGNVVRGRALADLIPVHMEKLHLAGSMTAAGPMLKQAKTAAIPLEQQSQSKRTKVA